MQKENLKRKGRRANSSQDEEELQPITSEQQPCTPAALQQLLVEEDTQQPEGEETSATMAPALAHNFKPKRINPFLNIESYGYNTYEGVLVKCVDGCMALLKITTLTSSPG
jgi:hypothetical protein